MLLYYMLLYGKPLMSEINRQTIPFLINGLSAETLADALREYGCRAQIDGPDGQAPRIMSGIQGLRFMVHPLDDPVGEKFSRWRFVVGFNGNHPCRLVTANEFNRAYQFGKFFVDSDGDPNLEWVWDFGGGVSPAYLPRVFEHWGAAIACFQRHLCANFG